MRLAEKADWIAAGWCVPTTCLTALLTYAIEHVDAGYIWTEVLAAVDDEGTVNGDWYAFLHRAVLGAMEDATAQA